ncbi:MAG: hypothetical protein ABL876_03870 [Chitinophagaceae bacterium]
MRHAVDWVIWECNLNQISFAKGKADKKLSNESISLAEVARPISATFNALRKCSVELPNGEVSDTTDDDSPQGPVGSNAAC